MLSPPGSFPGAAGGSGHALVSAREEDAGASQLVRTAGSLRLPSTRVAIAQPGAVPCLWDMRIPCKPLAVDKLGAIKVESVFLSLLFAGSGQVLHAELEKRFAKTFFHYSQTKTCL